MYFLPAIFLYLKKFFGILFLFASGYHYEKNDNRWSKIHDWIDTDEKEWTRYIGGHLFVPYILAHTWQSVITSVSVYVLVSVSMGQIQSKDTEIPAIPRIILRLSRTEQFSSFWTFLSYVLLCLKNKLRFLKAWIFLKKKTDDEENSALKLHYKSNKKFS